MKNKETGAGGVFFLLLVALYLLVPLTVTVIYSFTSDWRGILPRGITFQYFLKIATDHRFWLDVMRSVIISVVPVFISVIIVILALYVAVVYFPPLEQLIEILCMIPYTINGVVLATAVLATYLGTHTIFSNRIVMLTCIYCIGGLPIEFRAIRNNMYAVNLRQLLEAAEILGAGKLYAFVRVVVPCMVSGIMVSMLMTMAGIFGDFTIIKIIASSQYETAMMYLYNYRIRPIQETSSIVTIMLVVTFIIIFSTFILQNRGKRKAVTNEE